MEEKKGKSLWRRIRIYLVGVIIGSLLSFMFFKGRGCDAWTPSHRVTELLTQNALIANDSVLCKMEANQLSITDIQRLVVTGDVLFNESKTKGNPQVYVLEGVKMNGEMYRASFQVSKHDYIQDTISYLIGVSGKEVDCNAGGNKLIHLSDLHRKKIIHTDSKLLLTDIVPNQVKELNLNLDSLLYGMAKGDLNTTFSDPDLKPKTLFVFDCLVENKKLKVSFTKNGEVIEVLDVRERK